MDLIFRQQMDLNGNFMDILVPWYTMIYPVFRHTWMMTIALGETDAGVYQVSDLPVFGCPLLLVAQLIRRQFPLNYQRKLLVKWTLVYQKIWERPLRLVSDWFLGMFSMEECVISQFSQWQIQVFAFGILLACWLCCSQKESSSKMFQVLWCFLARRIIPIKIG